MKYLRFLRDKSSQPSSASGSGENSMGYLRFLRDESRGTHGQFVFLAVVSGIANGLLISFLVHAAGSRTPASEQLRELFLCVTCLALYMVTRKRLLDRTSDLVDGLIRVVRVRVSDKIRTSDLQSFRWVGKRNIRQVLSQDCQTISDAAQMVAGSIGSGIAVLAAFLYIAFLSFDALVLIAALLAVSVIIFQRNREVTRREIMQAWEEEGNYFDALDDQLDGFVELSMNRRKSDDLFEHGVVAAAKRSEAIKLKSAYKLNFDAMFGECFFFALMTLIIFVFPRILREPDLPVAALVATVLFITGPIGQVVTSTLVIARANVATIKVKALEAKLDQIATDRPVDEAFEKQTFDLLRCEGVVYRYPAAEDERVFQLGPVNLEIRRGEVVFLVGGNGTGKSTLLNLLCGLLQPVEGHIELNGKQVTLSRRAGYQSYFAAILQDFHLFQRLLGLEHIDHGRVDELLSMLRIEHVTGVDKLGQFTNTKLSTGQRKRLALLVLELDDRDIYVFDEWAADQDPDYRDYFYNVYLASLRRRGKTVIAATHDDHYFHVADRILKLDDGHLVPFAKPGPEDGSLSGEQPKPDSPA